MREPVFSNENGSTVIRFQHQNGSTVIRFQDNCIQISCGGYRNRSTKECINSYLPAGYHLNSEKGFCYISTPDTRYTFKDDMVIDCINKTCDVPSYDIALSEYKKRRKAITRYIDTYAEKLFSREMEPPGNGDCFYCHGMLSSSDHIQLHIDDAIPYMTHRSRTVRRIF